MLGYGAIARKYKYEMAQTLNSIGYHTSSFGKDHFGYTGNTFKDFQPLRHGYNKTDLYEVILIIYIYILTYSNLILNI